MVHYFALAHEVKFVEQLEDGVPRLVDRENHSSALGRQPAKCSVRPELGQNMSHSTFHVSASMFGPE